MKIRNRLLTMIGGTMVVLLIITFISLAKIMSDNITNDLQTRLQNQVNSLTTQISDLVKTSARSYLTSTCEQADVTAKMFYRDSEDGPLPYDEAKQLVMNHLVNVKFMDSGYMYITDKTGVILAHPNADVVGTTSSLSSWYKSLSDNERVFYDYEYKGRNKLLYRVYNPEFEINIVATAYTSDFFKSIDDEVFHETIQTIKVGKTGYPFIMDKDGIVITHPDPAINGKSGLKYKDNDGNDFFKRILEEKEGDFRYNWKDPNGTIREKFVYYTFESNSELSISVTGYVDDFFELVSQTSTILIFSALIITIIIMFLIFLVSSGVTKPILTFTSNLKDISEGEGDLTKRIEFKDKSEIGFMTTLFNKFLETLHSLISNIKVSSERTLLIKDDINQGVENTSAAIYQITENLNSINDRTGYLNSNIDNSAVSFNRITDNIQELNNSILNQSQMLESSTAAITEMTSSIDNVSKITADKQNSAMNLINSAKEGSDVIDNTQSAVQEVSNQLSTIQEMAKIISDIADQTNLLAMNAAIEAAHAGDAGKGFAVVADEIRKLAENSSHNSTQITNVLKQIESSIILADDLSKNTKSSFSVINSEIMSIADALKEIDLSTSELQIGGKDILESITGLEKISQDVQERSAEIKVEAGEVNSSLQSSLDLTMEVTGAINEISAGTDDISNSISNVERSAKDLVETGNNLSESVNRFKT